MFCLRCIALAVRFSIAVGNALKDWECLCTGMLIPKCVGMCWNANTSQHLEAISAFNLVRYAMRYAHLNHCNIVHLH